MILWLLKAQNSMTLYHQLMQCITHMKKIYSSSCLHCKIPQLNWLYLKRWEERAWCCCAMRNNKLSFNLSDTRAMNYYYLINQMSQDFFFMNRKCDLPNSPIVSVEGIKVSSPPSEASHALQRSNTRTKMGRDWEFQVDRTSWFLS